MSRDEALSQVTEVFRDVFDDDDLVVRPEMVAADIPGWDSLKMINLLVAIEARLGVRLRSSEVDTLRCVGDIVDIVAARG